MKYQHLLGLLLCASVFFAGFLLKGHLGLYLNLASLMIVVGGSATAALLCFRLERLGIVARVVRASYRSRLKPEAEIVDIILKTMPLALTSILYGLILANFVFIPCAANLRERTNHELLLQKIILEGIIAIEGEVNPTVLKTKLLSFLTPSERKADLVPLARIRERFRIEDDNRPDPPLF